MKKFFSIIFVSILTLTTSLFIVSQAYSVDGVSSPLVIQEAAANTRAMAAITGSETLKKQADELEEIAYGSVYSKPQGCEKGSDTECVPYCKYEKVEECLLCPVFAVVFNTVSRLGAIAISTFSNSVVRVVVVAFGIWLAIQILLFASSPETRDLKDLLQSMITQGFLVVIVVAIIETGVANFFSTFVNPVYTTGQSMAQTMFSADVCNTGKEGVECSEEDKTIAKKTFSSIKKIDNGLPQGMGNSIMQTMTMMENRIRKFKTLGSSMMCQSWKEKVFLFLPRPIYMITGLIIWAVTMALIFGIPFLMVDSVFQLGVAAALLPIAVGSYAFKVTRQYSKKVWETFLNSAFAFLFISVVVVIVLGTIQASVTEGMTELMKDVPGNPTFEDLFKGADAAQKTYFEVMLKNFAWFSSHFIKLIFVFVLAWSVMSTAKDFAGEFADSISSTSIGSSIGTMAASTAKGMGIKAGKPLASATGRGLSRGVQRVARGTRHGVRRAWNAGTQAFRFRNSKTDENGNKSYTDKKGGFHTLKNGVETHQTKDKTVIKTKNMTLIRKKAEVNGKAVFHDEVKLNNDKLHAVLGRDGRINTKEMAKMLDGLEGEERKLMQVALTKAVMEQRFSRDAHQYGRAKTLSSEVSMNDKTGEITVKEVDASGRVTFSKMKLNDNGYLEASLTQIDKNGNVTILSNDGIRTKMEKFKLQDGVNASSLNDMASVRASRSSKPAKVSYGYTKYWQHQVDHGYDDREIPLGGMSAREVYGATDIFGKDGKSFGTLLGDGTIIDAEGNEIGRKNKSGILDKDGNIIFGTDGYEERRVGGQFSEFVHGQGNEFQKGDMEYYFR